MTSVEQRKILESITTIGPLMNESETSAIAKVLFDVTERLIKESEGE